MDDQEKESELSVKEKRILILMRVIANILVLATIARVENTLIYAHDAIQSNIRFLDFFGKNKRILIKYLNCWSKNRKVFIRNRNFSQKAYFLS